MPILASIFFMAMMGYLQAQLIPAHIEQDNLTEADAVATSFLAYRMAAIKYFGANPCTTGSICTVANDNLNAYLLTGYNIAGARSQWGNVYYGNTLYVYETTPTGSTIALDENLLFEKTDGTAMLGHVDAGGSFSGTRQMRLGYTLDPLKFAPNSLPALVMVGG